MKAQKTFKILCINPGSTSTKIGLFANERQLKSLTISHSDAELARFSSVAQQFEFRAAKIRETLALWRLDALDAAVGRGGLLPPIAAGTYRVTPKMLNILENSVRGEHASNLGAPLANAAAAEWNAPAFIVDPVCVDELLPEMRITGLKELKRESLCHALNIRAIAHRYALKKKTPLTKLNLIVAHLGGGFSFAAIEKGRMIDVINPRDEGPFSPERAGGLPFLSGLEYFMAKPDLTFKDIERRLFGRAGVFSHFGTRDMRVFSAMVASGNRKAAMVYEAMALQAAKAIAALSASLSGRVDAILLTGGVARDKAFIGKIKKRIKFIAPLFAFPGEDELKAMAEGALRVLTKKEAEKRL